jgi:hypothetical protein
MIGSLAMFSIFLAGPEVALGQSSQHRAGPSAKRHASATTTPWGQLPSVSFPGTGRTSIKSPNGRYILENIDCNSCDRVGDWHTIFLIDTKEHNRKILYRYGRWVNVLWAPSSDAIAINDFYASDASRSRLFTLNPKLEETNLGEKLIGEASVPASEREFTDDGYPVFIFVERWLSFQALQLKVAGYADVDDKGFHNPFSFVYEYRLGDSFTPVSIRK